MKILFCILGDMCFIRNFWVCCKNLFIFIVFCIFMIWVKKINNKCVFLIFILLFIYLLINIDSFNMYKVLVVYKLIIFFCRFY